MDLPPGTIMPSSISSSSAPTLSVVLKKSRPRDVVTDDLEQTPISTKRKLNYNKCEQCRKSKLKCEPAGRSWPDRCVNCISRKLCCSEFVKKKGGRPLHSQNVPTVANPGRPSALRCVSSVLGPLTEVAEGDFSAPPQQALPRTNPQMRITRGRERSGDQTTSQSASPSIQVTNPTVEARLLAERVKCITYGSGLNFALETLSDLMSVHALALFKLDHMPNYGRSSAKLGGYQHFEEFVKNYNRKLILRYPEGSLTDTIADQAEQLAMLVESQRTLARLTVSSTKSELVQFCQSHMDNFNIYFSYDPDSSDPSTQDRECPGWSQLLNKANFLGQQPLHFAAIEGDLDMCEALLAQPGIEYDTPDLLGRSPLHYAVLGGHVHIMQTLLLCPDVNLNRVDNYGHTPLHSAVHKKQRLTILPLLERGADMHCLSTVSLQTPYDLAIQNRDMDILMSIGSHRNFDVNHVYWANGIEFTPLARAIFDRFSLGVSYLLEHKEMNVNAYCGGTCTEPTYTVLALAIKEGWTEGVQIILNHPRVDVNLGERGNVQRTPLWIAVSNNLEVIVKILLQRRELQLKEWDDPDNVLKHANRCGHRGCALLILSQMAKRNMDIGDGYNICTDEADMEGMENNP